MKVLKTMAMLVVLGAFSSGAISAELLTKEELNNGCESRIVQKG